MAAGGRPGRSCSPGAADLPVHQLLVGALSAAPGSRHDAGDADAPHATTRRLLAGGNDEASCRAFADCVVTRLGADRALMEDAADGALGDDSAVRWRETVSACFAASLPSLPFDESGG